MNNIESVLNSFTIREELNPKVWQNSKDDESPKMNNKVLGSLRKISEEFIDYLGDDIFVEDIVLTGSLANYNWSEYSDFDLHIIVNMQQYEEDNYLYKEIFDLKKASFNDKHDIKVHGYDVELYVQDIEEEHTASGMYSILNNEWIVIPKKTEDTIDKNLLKKKIKNWVEKINKTIEESEKSNEDDVLGELKEKLKKYRKSGLDKEGEFSYENLTFKALRRLGIIKKLFDAKNKVFDKRLSLEREQLESKKFNIEVQS